MISVKHLYRLVVLLLLSFQHYTGKSMELPIGYSIDIHSITDEKMQYVHSLGIEYIEIAGVGAMLDKNLAISYTEEYWENKIENVGNILNKYQIKVWSIHMPFSKFIDISVVDEGARKYVVESHLKLMTILQGFDPQVVLFHPSYYLEKGERALRYAQLTKSVKELYLGLKKYKVQMVVENMLGPSLEIGERERPLLRTVQECVDLFKSFPKKVGIAVDMCHIAQSELLLQAFGNRVKTLHVSDGDGKTESHYLPCGGLGKNNWNQILSALEKIKYKGVFMYECKFTDERELVDCYNLLQQNYSNYKLNNAKRNNEKY